MPSQRVYNQMDLSGGIQVSTSHLLKKRNEVVSSKNANFNKVIGSATRRDGYEKVGRTIEHGKDSLGAFIYKYGQNNKILVGANDSTDSNATLRVYDQDQYYTTVLTASPNTRFNACNFLEELYVGGLNDANTFLPLTNIDSSLSSSTTRNVYGAPAAQYVCEFNGSILALNCRLNGVTYWDRAYYSSPPLGAVTFVQTDQKGLLKQLRVDSTRYLKAGMQVDIYGAGTEAKKQSAITIVSIDKKNKRITFAATQIDVADNDEIWLTGRKGKLSIFWNTDDPNPEQADYLRIPPDKDNSPRFTGWAKNNNRLLMFTRNSFYKYDGNNLISVSDTVGCVSHESIQNIGSWTIWLHDSGVWGYNDNTGNLKLLSRGMDKYIKAINQINLPYASAVTINKVYKLAVGELLPLDSITTSTSTSSTSTSSTSSSTSSTSTSSTSTSSTSTSATTFTTSTSSTSSSTSSTSASTTSTSISTSTSSTSTSTLLSTKNVTRLCYDFDMNAWWTETHKREMRYQFVHTMHGYTKAYFTDETGRLFRDETANVDNGDSIPYEVELGRNNFATDQRKNYLSVIIDSERARGMTVQYSVDGGQYKTLGQCTENITTLEFPKGGQTIEGRDISYKFVHNDSGDAPVLNGVSTYYSISEGVVYG